jgi:hypothetical protein
LVWHTCLGGIPLGFVGRLWNKAGEYIVSGHTHLTVEGINQATLGPPPDPPRRTPGNPPNPPEWTPGQISGFQSGETFANRSPRWGADRGSFRCHYDFVRKCPLWCCLIDSLNRMLFRRLLNRHSAAPLTQTRRRQGYEGSGWFVDRSTATRTQTLK